MQVGRLRHPQRRKRLQSRIALVTIQYGKVRLSIHRRSRRRRRRRGCSWGGSCRHRRCRKIQRSNALGRHLRSSEHLHGRLGVRSSEVPAGQVGIGRRDIGGERVEEIAKGRGNHKVRQAQHLPDQVRPRSQLRVQRREALIDVLGREHRGSQGMLHHELGDSKLDPAIHLSRMHCCPAHQRAGGARSGDVLEHRAEACDVSRRHT
mmetsp:Transcript_12635/g.46669  ORF Transcript_12635/g.46669 Transcript_12635/m.46669 type:complete len:206 (+) Transcript_12635:3411-4028(+)